MKSMNNLIRVLFRLKIINRNLFGSLPLLKLVHSQHFYNDRQICKKSSLETLEDLLEIRSFAARELLERNSNLSKVDRTFLTDNFHLYIANGISKKTLINYCDLLTVTNLEEKIKLIKRIPLDINDTIVLATLPLKKLMGLVADEIRTFGKGGRINILSKYLYISKLEACQLISEKQFLLALSSQAIESKLKLLAEYGVKPEDIRNDLWVLRYSTKLITSRLNEVKLNYNVDKIKTWMVRASPEIVQHYMQRRSDNKSILGNFSLAEYLSERLECSLEIANYIILKQPVLKNKSLIKLKDQIDCLLSAGFKPWQIIRVPKILVHSVETTTKRLKQLEDKDIKLDSLSMLTKSQREFNLQFEMLLKNKNKTQNA